MFCFVCFFDQRALHIQEILSTYRKLKSQMMSNAYRRLNIYGCSLTSSWESYTCVKDITGDKPVWESSHRFQLKKIYLGAISLISNVGNNERFRGMMLN